MNLQELVSQLQSEQLMKHDFVVPSKHIGMTAGEILVGHYSKKADTALEELLRSTGIAHRTGGQSVLPLQVLPACHEQIAAKLQIPKLYYDRMNTPENIPCLDANVNHWFDRSKTNYFLRTFINKGENKGHLRALLSDRFNVIDNFDVLMAALEAIKQAGADVTIESCDVTERKMYVRFVSNTIAAESRKLLSRYRLPDGTEHGNNNIVTGFVLSNSETGYGQFTLAPRLVVLACRNGLIVKRDALQRVHLGAKMESLSEIKWSEETEKKSLELIVSQTKDAVNTFLTSEYLGKAIEELEQGAEPLAHPIDAIKNVSRELQFSEEKQKKILEYFISSSDNTAFGISQAVTYFAHMDAGADERNELEIAAVEIASNPSRYDKPFLGRAVRYSAN